MATGPAYVPEDDDCVIVSPPVSVSPLIPPSASSPVPQAPVSQKISCESPSDKSAHAAADSNTDDTADKATTTTATAAATASDNCGSEESATGLSPCGRSTSTEPEDEPLEAPVSHSNSRKHVAPEDAFKFKTLLDKTEMYSKFLSSKLSQAPPTTVIQSPESTKQRKSGKTKGKESPTKKFQPTQCSTSTNSTKHSQPGNVIGGTLRGYQIEGLNWLIQLFENGVNGILADEMGLGKTIVCISFIAHLWNNGIHGPFLIVAPVSTLANWTSEFSKWAPSIPVQLYHGGIQERAVLRGCWSVGRTQKRRKVDSETPDNGKKSGIPVVVTSYNISINDRKFLQKIKWKYLVVDEAHRLKNFNCKLIAELRMLTTEGRLLMTGTPLQNNLSELWSLLNFLLPELFDDVESFKNWFDFTDIISDTNHTDVSGGDKTSTLHQDLVSKLHNVLRPFLLRRRKQDVEVDIPKKLELVLYTSFTPDQKIFYNAVKHRSLAVKSISLNNLLMHLRKVCNHPFLFDKDLIKRVLEDAENPEKLLASLEKQLEELPRLRPRVNLQVAKVSKKSKKKTASKKAGKKRAHKSSSDSSSSDSSSSDSDSDSDSSTSSVEPKTIKSPQVAPKDTGKKPALPRSSYNVYLRECWANHRKQKELDPTNCDPGSATDINSKFAATWAGLSPEQKEKYSHMLQSELEACEKLTEEPAESMTTQEKINQLVNSSGKMQLLHKMLSRLCSEGHKVLIFSQMTRMLDIIEDYLELSDYNYCRIDGKCAQQDRQTQIEAFTNNPNILIFLLSTRAGGVGINLTAADTVIIYDSDWNPQMDLQAQDRCHRIGQTKSVVVYRLITANSVESVILQRARSKLILERLVVEKGGFSRRGSSSIISKEDLTEILCKETHNEEHCISDTDLLELLDRTKVFATQERHQRMMGAATVAPPPPLSVSSSSPTDNHTIPSSTNTSENTSTTSTTATTSTSTSTTASTATSSQSEPSRESHGFEFVQQMTSQF
ncbi:ATP dependent chromatin remodeling factor [Pelomyxa schiedti]|nr:ATP dependent chromatin remodeling factor [Pelomyxa schiedti]